MSDRPVSDVWIAFAPHYPQAFVRPTRREAIEAARVEAYHQEGVRPFWRTMQRNGWRVIKGSTSMTADTPPRWRPIETAPRDHFPRLVWAKNWPICVAFLDVNWTWWPVPAHQPLDWTPTDWQPLDAPPEDAAP